MRNSQVARPFFVSLVAWISAVHALMWLYFAFVVFGPNSTGSFTFAGKQYLVADHWLLLALGMLGVWLYAVIVAFGFFRQISWSRYIFLAPLIGQTIFGIFYYGFSGGALIVIAIMAVIVWYFFGKQNVVSYFEALQ